MTGAMAPAIDWWQSRAPRERGLLTILAILTGLMLVWFAVVVPIRDADRAATADLADAVTRRDAIRNAIANGNAATTVAAPGDVVALAEATGLTATILDGEADLVRFRIDSARADDLFNWLAGLETDHGLEVRAAEMMPTPAGTLSLTATVSAKPS
ncbi:MAG: type II secretion system protein GspM [Pseudomonadota bacterium]